MAATATTAGSPSNPASSMPCTHLVLVQDDLLRPVLTALATVDAVRLALLQQVAPHTHTHPPPASGTASSSTSCMSFIEVAGVLPYRHGQKMTSDSLQFGGDDVPPSPYYLCAVVVQVRAIGVGVLLVGLLEVVKQVLVKL